MTTHTYVCKLIALYTVNTYSAEREMSASACTCSVPGYVSCNCEIKLSSPL